MERGKERRLGKADKDHGWWSGHQRTDVFGFGRDKHSLVAANASLLVMKSNDFVSFMADPTE